MEIKFQTLENAEATATLKQHIFIAKECKEPWTREPYPGNISLCKRVWCSEDGTYAQDFAQMENELFDKPNCCKICISIAEKNGVRLEKNLSLTT